MDLEKIYHRSELVLGKQTMEKIKESKICICGIGGVGSYVLEALARTGIGEITVIDKDDVDITNVNRQIIATVNNVGKSKVDEAVKRINSINPTIHINGIKEYIDESNIDKLITKDLDYVIDAIDSVDSKIAIIKRCKEIGVKVISCMGTANKIDPLKLTVTDIAKTEMCPLAKVVRKKLKEMNITKVKVVYSTEPAIKNNEGVLGSVSYVPSVAGLLIASEVVKDISKELV